MPSVNFSYNLIYCVCPTHKSVARSHAEPNHFLPGHVAVEGDSMAVTNRIRKNTAGCAGLFNALIIILVLACGAQTGTGKAQLEQKSSRSEIKHTGRTGISQMADKQRSYVLDEVLVKFKSDTDAKAIEGIQTALNLEIIRKFSSRNLFLMKITDGSPVETVIKALKAYEVVSYAEPNYVVKASQ